MTTEHADGWQPRRIDRIDAGMRRLAAAIAILGGMGLVLVILATVASVTGRALIPLGLRPIRGDFELIELAAGFAVFSFLPWCQINRQHASVELLTARLGDAVNRWIDLVCDILMFLVAALIAVQHGRGMLDKYGYGETTFVLQYPIWWAYAAGLAGAAVFLVVSLHCVMRSIDAIATGLSPTTGSAHH